MTRKMKLWILIASALVLVGGMIFVGGMSMLNWNFKQLSMGKFQTNTYEITEVVENITVVTNTADLVFAPSEDGKIKVVCHEMELAQHAVSVDNGNLIIQLEDTRKWYQRLGIQFEQVAITVYLPAGNYGTLSATGKTGDTVLDGTFTFASVDICMKTGDICVENISIGDLSLSVSTGDIKASQVNCAGNATFTVSTGDICLQSVQCKNLTSTGSTGDLTMAHVLVEEKMHLRRSTGDISFKKCDAGEIYIQNGTGDVIGSLLSEKVFLAETGTGDVEVPKSTTGGRCEITTGTGDIIITLE